MRFERISVDHRVMGGVPCIIGTHLPVATIVSLVAEGRTPTDIVANYPQLVVDGVRAAFAPRSRRIYCGEIMIPTIRKTVRTTVLI